LTESGYAFRIAVIHTAVQGLDAEKGVAAALAAAAELARARGIDCIALVRGGGSKSDLAAFDSREIALAVARCPLPVLTGLGHEIDQSVADRVAFQAFKTPTKVAEFLVARIEGAELAVARLGERLLRAAPLPLGRARERTLSAERRLLIARGVLERAGQRVATLVWRLVGAAKARLATEVARLEGRARLVAGFDPERTLARGFSITRRESGALVRSADVPAAGARIVTTLAGGARVASRVEAE
jgi:exodeoxyribonuclease VII large subunit